MFDTRVKALVINPYKFQPRFGSHFEKLDSGRVYRVVRTLIVELGKAPMTQKGRDNPGCCARDCSWILREDGALLLMPGFVSNGPNFVDDAECRMLASFVHDALCSEEAAGAYSYAQLHRFYSQICYAQGEARWFSEVQFAGLFLAYWAKWRLEKMFNKRRFRK